MCRVLRILRSAVPTNKKIICQGVNEEPQVHSWKHNPSNLTPLYATYMRVHAVGK